MLLRTTDLQPTKIAIQSYYTTILITINKKLYANRNIAKKTVFFS